MAQIETIEGRLAQTIAALHIELAKLGSYCDQMSNELAKARSEATTLRIELDALKASAKAA